MIRLFATLFLLATPLAAQEHRAGVFDYYVLSLSWSPSWCALTGDARGSPQCDESEDHGWILHGLWPQYERGYPQNCNSRYQNPSRRDTSDMADIMGTSGLAWHQWNKHGRCTDLNSNDYFALSREAYAQIIRPEVFRNLDRSVTLPASVIEDAFLKANPTMAANQITITCKANYIQEARICLTRGLEFRTCGADVIRDCSLDDAQFDPIR